MCCVCVPFRLPKHFEISAWKISTAIEAKIEKSKTDFFMQIASIFQWKIELWKLRFFVNFNYFMRRTPNNNRHINQCFSLFFFFKFSRKIMLIFSTRHICILIAWKTVYEMFKTLQIFLRRMQFGDQPVN